MWPRIGRLVEAKPLALAVGVLAILVAGALGNLSDRGTLDFSEQFRNPPESVLGLRQLQEKFPPGQAGPGRRARRARRASPRRCRHSRPRPFSFSTDLVGFSRDDRLALVRVTLNQDPFTETAAEVIPQIRELAR